MINFEEVFTSFVTFLPRLGGALLIFVAFWIMARVLRAGVLRYGNTRRLSPDVTNLMIQVTEAALLIFGAVTALGTIGINVGALIAGLGLAGFALGFALKDLLSNILAGLLILVYNPFVRGDTITISGNQGQVIEINMRYTVLQGDEKKILIPNAKMFDNIVEVHRKSQRRLPGSDSGE